MKEFDDHYRRLFQKYGFDYDKLPNPDLEIVCPSCETWYTVKDVPIVEDKLNKRGEYIHGYYCDCHGRITECDKVTDTGSRMNPWNDEFNAIRVEIVDDKIKPLVDILEELDIKCIAGIIENEPYSKTAEAVKWLNRELEKIVEASIILRR